MQKCNPIGSRKNKHQYELLNQKVAAIAAELNVQTEQLNSLKTTLTDASIRAEISREELDDALKLLIVQLGDLKFEIGVHEGRHQVKDRSK